jgi:hemerythrin superfamily protein
MANTTKQEIATVLLQKQHEQVMQLFAEMIEAQGDARKELFDCLRAMLAVHETAEEIVIYPEVRGLGRDDVADARIAEEGAAKQALADLEKLGPDGDGFGPKALQLQNAVREHAEAEESTVFSLLDRECSEAHLRELGERIEVAEHLAPTHPHPHGPDSAIGNLLVGPFAKMIDTVRDKLSH